MRAFPVILSLCLLVEGRQRQSKTLDIESVLIAAFLIAVLGVGYKMLRRRAPEDKPTAPEHFFGGAGDETVLPESRISPSEMQPLQAPETKDTPKN